MVKYIKPFLVIIPVVGLFLLGFYFLNYNKAVKTAPIDLIKYMETKGAFPINRIDFQGKQFSLENLSGTVTVINFWASWCAPCVEEIPSLIKLSEHFKNNLKIVAISADTEKIDVEVFLRSFPSFININTHIILDNQNEIMKNYDVDRLPESFIFNKEMKLVKKISGSLNWYTPDSISYFDNLISEKN